MGVAFLLPLNANALFFISSSLLIPACVKRPCRHTLSLTLSAFLSLSVISVSSVAKLPLPPFQRNHSPKASEMPTNNASHAGVQLAIQFVILKKAAR